MLEEVIGINSMPYTMGIRKVWVSLRKSLSLNTHLGNLEPHWRIPNILWFPPTTKHLNIDTIMSANSTFGRIGVKKVGDLWNEHLFQWIDFSPKLTQLSNVHHFSYQRVILPIHNTPTTFRPSSHLLLP